MTLSGKTSRETEQGRDWRIRGRCRGRLGPSSGSWRTHLLPEGRRIGKRPPDCAGGLFSLSLRLRLLEDLGHDAGAAGAAALTDGEAELLFHGDRRDQLHVQFGVV